MQNFCNHPRWNAELCRALRAHGDMGHELRRKWWSGLARALGPCPALLRKASRFTPPRPTGRRWPACVWTGRGPPWPW